MTALNPKALAAAAAAIANERGMRRGVPTISNVIDILPVKLRNEVFEDARACIEAYHASEPDAVAVERAEPFAWFKTDVNDRPYAFVSDEFSAGVCEEQGYILTAVYTPPDAVAVERATQAARDVLAERQRQIDEEGWTPAHDDSHDRGELAEAAACYLREDAAHWPWDFDWWKPKDRRHDLVVAGALILAEIERLDRARSQP